MKLDWLNELINSFPETEKTRRNLIEIAGYPSWETVISNLLAFYFDAEEEHKFGKLFLESLVELIEEKSDESISEVILESSFNVERERNRIDVLLTCADDDEDISESYSWAILIENKIGAALYNPLDVYWNSVDSKLKVGVVLSVDPVPKKDLKVNTGSGIVKFINVLHKELTSKIKEKLSIAFEEGDDRHLLFLREYFANISDHYENKKNSMKNDEMLLKFHGKRNEIQKFLDADNNLLIYVSDVVFDVLKNFGFEPKNMKKTSKGKHFFPSVSFFKDVAKQHTPHEYRIWVNLSKLRYEDIFEAYFELDGKNNSMFGSSIKGELKDKVSYTKYVSEGKGGSNNASYQHIYALSIPVENIEENGFKDSLEYSLKTHFFGNEQDFIRKAHAAYNKSK